MPIAWKVASTTVPSRVYCVILRLPASPSFFYCSSFGITDLIYCMMMLAEMYGMMPRARMLARSRAPPENMLNMSRIDP